MISLSCFRAPENAAQHAEQPAGHVALMAGEFARDVIGGDLPQGRPGRRPRGQGRPGDAQVATDAPEAGRGAGSGRDRVG
jgi:hypothetical protein